jgi:DNA polymerase-1
MKNFVILDAYAVLHRAFHALPSFTSTKGEPTGALYGFTSFLIKTIRELKPDYIAACYDLAEPTFRHVAYDQYKASRPQKDDVLIQQINRSRDILKAFKIPVFDSLSFEADDIIATVVTKLLDISDIKIFIASGDMDLLQLVDDDRVVVYTLSKGITETVIYNEEKVKERFGFGPEMVVDYKALRGDPSDNIIGVPGIGEKTATDLILKFGSIENLYKILKENKTDLEKAGIKERIIKLLEENEEGAMFSKTLAEARRDAPIEFSLDQCLWRDGIQKNDIEKILGEFGFKSLIARLNTLL